MEEISHLHAKPINHCKFKYQLTFKKNGGDDEITNQIELPITLSTTHNSKQSEIDNINIHWSLEKGIKSIELKEAGLNYQKINSMSISLHKSGELNGSGCVKMLLRSNALVNNKFDDKYCFFWSKLASLFICNNDHPKRVSNYKQLFEELNIQGCDFTNGLNVVICINLKK